MAAFYASQAYDARAALIWSILTDFPTWPKWFPNMSTLQFEEGHVSGPGAQLLALANDQRRWTRWRISDWKEPELLVCHFDGTNAAFSGQVQAAYLQFGLLEEPEGCTLEVEVGAEGSGLVSDFLVGATLGMNARRTLPKLVDAFTDHVIERCSELP